MTTGLRSDASGTFGALTFGGDDILRFGSDNSGALAGFRNILINGDMRINQRGVTIAAAANGAYGPDRWKKVDASNMTQIVEEGNFIPSATYTLSGTGVTTQQITSPAAGDWTLPNIPIAATKVQLELGSIATPFEHRPVGLELSLCQRYCRPLNTGLAGWAASANLIGCGIVLQPRMRAAPTVSTPSAPLTFTDFVVDVVQSSAQVGINLVTAEGITLTFNNFTGLTGFREYVMRGTALTLLTSEL